MNILLDECQPRDFRHSFPGHDAHTAQWAGLKGKANGELLRTAELAGYDILLTVDQGHAPATTLSRLAIVLIHARTNQIEDLLPLVDAILEALLSIKPGRILWIPAGQVN